MDIGVWMSAEVLEHKLHARQEHNTEQAWNLSRWPTGFTQEGEHRLFVCILSRRIPGFRRLAFPEKTVGNSRVLP